MLAAVFGDSCSAHRLRSLCAQFAVLPTPLVAERRSAACRFQEGSPSRCPAAASVTRVANCEPTSSHRPDVSRYSPLPVIYLNRAMLRDGLGVMPRDVVPF